MNKSFNINHDYHSNETTNCGTLTESKKSGYLTPSDPNRSFKNKFRFLKFSKKSSNSKPNSTQESQSNNPIPDLPTFQSIKNIKYCDENDVKYKKKENNSLINLNADAVAEIGTVHAEATIYNNKFVTSKEYITEHNKQNTSKIKFRNIPPNMGITSIISQVSGGGLREIRVSYKDRENKIIDSFQIEFKDRENALTFMKYSSSNYFKVNGVHISPKWSWESDSESSQLILNSFDVKEVSRAIVLKQHPTRIRKLSKCMEFNLPLYPLNITEIINDFSNFGKIISIAPVVSRKLCVSIFFLNIQSAIKVMEEFQKPSSPLSIKYSKTWMLWFGKDTTDIPCMEF